MVIQFEEISVFHGLKHVFWRFWGKSRVIAIHGSRSSPEKGDSEYEIVLSEN